MYTWGDGSGGKLGNGNQQDLESPQRLHTLWGQPVRHIAVSGTKCTHSLAPWTIKISCIILRYKTLRGAKQGMSKTNRK